MRAESWISGQRLRHITFVEENGQTAVRRQLCRWHSWKKGGLNCWQVVTFCMLANAKWFCWDGPLWVCEFPSRSLNGYILEVAASMS